jgi:predicted dehydrogenase
MSKTDRLTVAVVGAGNMVAGIHLPILRALAKMQVVGVYDPDAERLRALGDIYRDVPLFESLGGFSRLRCDVLCIVVPPQVLLEALRDTVMIAQRGIFVEKPLGTSAAMARRIAQAIPRHLTFCCGYNRRQWPAVQLMQRLMQQHGPLVQVSVSFNKHYADRETWRSSTDSLVTTEMCHALDLVGHLGGPVASASFVGADVTEDAHDVLLGQGRLERGGLWQVSCNFASGGMSSQIEMHALGLRLALRGSGELLVQYANREPAKHVIAEEEHRVVREGYVGEWLDFAARLTAGEPAIQALEGALATAELCDLAVEAPSRSG